MVSIKVFLFLLTEMLSGVGGVSKENQLSEESKSRFPEAQTPLNSASLTSISYGIPCGPPLPKSLQCARSSLGSPPML